MSVSPDQQTADAVDEQAAPADSESAALAEGRRRLWIGVAGLVVLLVGLLLLSNAPGTLGKVSAAMLRVAIQPQTAFSSRRSTAWKQTCPANADARASPRAASMSPKKTRAPWAAKARTMASPMPWAPPVMRTGAPWRSE